MGHEKFALTFVVSQKVCVPQQTESEVEVGFVPCSTS